MKCLLTTLVLLFSIYSLCYSQANKNIDQLYKAKTVFNETELSITPQLLANKKSFFDILKNAINTRDSIMSLVFPIEYTYDKSFSESSFKKRTKYNKNTPIFYFGEQDEDGFNFGIGISKNGDIEEFHELSFKSTSAELKSLNKMNLVKSKIIESFMISPRGEITLVDSAYFILDKTKKSLSVGPSRQHIFFSKYEFIKKCIEDFKHNINKDQFETTEQYLNRKIIASSILDSLYSMQFTQSLTLGGFEYDADKGIMKLNIFEMQPYYCELALTVEEAKALANLKRVSGIANCMISIDNELEIVSPIVFSALGKTFTVTPNNLIIPHSIKSIVTLEKYVEMISNTSDTLIVLNTETSNTQQLSVYRINDCSLKYTFEKPKYDSWFSKYLEPGNTFVDFIQGKYESQIKIIFTSLGNSSKKPTEITIDFEGSNRSFGLGKKRDYLYYNFLSDDSIITVDDPFDKKLHILDIVDQTETINNYNDQGTTPLQSYPSSGLIFISSSEKGFLNLYTRHSKGEFKYKLLRTISAERYLDLGENIYIERNGKHYLNNKISGDEKELFNFGTSNSASGFSIWGDYILTQNMPFYTVYDTKEDKYLGDIKIPKDVGEFKYGYIKKGVIPGTMQIITYAGIK